MKVSFVSSQAISQAMRYQTSRLQSDLVKTTKEMSTLRVADIGLALGARSSISVSLHREIDRLNGIVDSNELAATRLKATQIGLKELTDAEHVCTTPGLYFGKRVPRKVNAARVILKRALSSIAKGGDDMAGRGRAGGGKPPNGASALRRPRKTSVGRKVDADGSRPG